MIDFQRTLQEWGEAFIAYMKVVHPGETECHCSSSEMESHARGVADIAAGRFTVFEDVDELLRDLDDGDAR